MVCGRETKPQVAPGKRNQKEQTSGKRKSLGPAGAPWATTREDGEARPAVTTRVYAETDKGKKQTCSGRQKGEKKNRQEDIIQWQKACVQSDRAAHKHGQAQASLTCPLPESKKEEKKKVKEKGKKS